MYYCKVGIALRVGIAELKNDEDVGAFLTAGYKCKWVVDLNTEHRGNDAIDFWNQSENVPVDETYDSSDAYCYSEEDDLDFIEFHTEWENNVVIKNIAKLPFS